MADPLLLPSLPPIPGGAGLRTEQLVLLVVVPIVTVVVIIGVFVVARLAMPRGEWREGRVVGGPWWGGASGWGGG